MNREMTSIKSVYGIGLGILLAMLVGFGIAAFYENPGYYGNTDYYRNILLIAYPCGLIFAVAGLVLPTKFNVLRLGLVLGGLATMLYAIIYSASGHGMELGWVFAAVVIGLAVLIPLGYFKLASRDKETAGSEKGKNDEGQ